MNFAVIFIIIYYLGLAMKTRIALLLFILCIGACSGPSSPPQKQQGAISTQKKSKKAPKPTNASAEDKEKKGLQDLFKPKHPTYKKRPMGTLKWEHLEKGLDYAEVDASLKCSIGNSKLSLVRIDPTYFKFRLLSAKLAKTESLPADKWAKQEGLMLVFNAAMYQTDYLTSTGYMKSPSGVVNGFTTRDNSVVAFDPKHKSFPAFQIIDRECQNLDSAKARYRCLAQNIRMVDCRQKNVWSQQAKYWSMVAVGEDKKGRMLVLFTRTPYSVHDFINMLLKLPIGLQKAAYLEGGPEASLYLRSGKRIIAKSGSYETNFFDDGNDHFWPLPNVIGAMRR